MGAIMDFTLKDYINLQAKNDFFFQKISCHILI